MTRRGPDDVEITLCPDGPLLVRGPAHLVTDENRDLRRARSTVALCRCGGSAIKPYCDGTHKVNGFSTGDESGATRGEDR